MGSAWFYPFIIAAGALQAAGAVMNAQLRTYLVNPWIASFVSFVVVTVFFAGMASILYRPLPSLASVSDMPWWAPLGGLTGAVAVYAGLILIDKVGAGALNGLVISANILASIAIDHFGLLNAPVHAANIWRLIGGALMVAGIALVARF